MHSAPILFARGALLAAGLLFLSGCETTGSSPANPRAAPQAADAANPFDRLRAGLTEMEVRQLVGEPASIRPYVSNQVECVVWLYEHKLGEVVEQVPIATREVPLMNPLTGVMGTTQESVFVDEHRQTVETVEVLLLDRKVIAVKRSARIEKNRA